MVNLDSLNGGQRHASNRRRNRPAWLWTWAAENKRVRWVLSVLGAISSRCPMVSLGVSWTRWEAISAWRPLIPRPRHAASTSATVRALGGG